MHKTLGQRDPALAFLLVHGRDDADERRQANRGVAVSAAGLGVTGLAELLLAILTGSVGLLGDAIHTLPDVSTSAVVFLGFRLSRRPPTEKYPYGLERAEDLAGIGIAVTPSEQTERAEGLAFDVEKGADLPGVPIGDQAPKNPGADHTEQVVRKTGGGVGLAVPGGPDRSVEEPIDDEARQR